jgi:DnaJ-class molecular chaperone
MPQHDFPSQHGNMHVKFIVDLPRSLTKEQEEAVVKAFAQ